jgi:hypothetical protein
LTIELIESLKQTFALFVNPEKPQVSPWPAAGLTKKDAFPGRLEAAAVNPRPAPNEPRRQSGLPMYL